MRKSTVSSEAQNGRKTSEIGSRRTVSVSAVIETELTSSRSLSQLGLLCLWQQLWRTGFSRKSSSALSSKTPNAQSLAWLLRNVAEEVLVSSDVSRSVWSTTEDAGDWKSWRLSATGQAEHEFDSLADSNTGVKPLGSGSDYTAFLQRYGVRVALERSRFS